MNAPTPTQPNHDPTQTRRNRRMLLILAVMVFGSFLLAGVLRFSGWQPAGHKNKGEMLQPPGDLRQLAPTLANGSTYAWKPIERQWRILVANGEQCDAACLKWADDIEKVRLLQGRDADRVDILWLGAAPAQARDNARHHVIADAPALRAALPRANDANGQVTYIVDPNGFAILRYAPGTDAGNVRYDLSKLVKLR